MARSSFLVISLIFFLSACDSPVLFSPGGSKSGPEGGQIAPPGTPETPSPIDSLYEFNKGVCAKDGSTSLTSCMNCRAPAEAPAPPSDKGETLAEIIFSQCQIRNGSDPAGYVPPTKEEIQGRLRNCTGSLYPETPFQETEASTIQELLGPNPWLREKMFHGIYYKPPYSDDFASYFGIEVGETRHIFCYREGELRGDMYPKEWWDSEDRWNYPIPQRWIDANKVRAYLKSCMQPNSSPLPVTTQPASDYDCDYHTMKGPMGRRVLEKMAEWYAEGYVLGYESASLAVCKSYESGEQMPGQNSIVKVAAYRCLKK
jgi:hypothetical protein